MQCRLVLASTVRFLPLAFITVFVVFYLTHTPVLCSLLLLLLMRLLHRYTPIHLELFVLRQETLRCFLSRLIHLLRVDVVPLFLLNHSIVELVQGLLNILIRQACVVLGGDPLRRWHDPVVSFVARGWSCLRLHLRQF